MRRPLTIIFIFAVAVFTYVIWDNLKGISHSWQISEVLALWQIAIMAVGIVAATAAVYYAARQFVQNRQQESQARQESLSQIKGLLKPELEANLKILRSEQFRIWVEAPDDARGQIVILTRSLKTSAFELVAGREDLKYLEPPEALASISEAYDQIQDFNTVLTSWLSRGLKGEKVHYTWHDEVDLGVATTKYLQEHKQVTIAKVETALKFL